MTDIEQLQDGEFVRSYKDPLFPTQQRGRAKIRFFVDDRLNEGKSKKAGVPMYDSVECAEYIIPGDLKARPVEKVSGWHAIHYKEEYEAFKKGIEASPTGTPLEHWPRISSAQVKTLKAMDINTMEELAETNDNTFMNLGPGFRQLRDWAVDDLEARRDAMKVQAQKDEIDALKAQVAQLMGGGSEVAQSDKPKRGRPRKVDRPAETQGA